MQVLNYEEQNKLYRHGLLALKIASLFVTLLSLSFINFLLGLMC